MKYKLGLLHEPVAPPVNLREIYERVKHENPRKSYHEEYNKNYYKIKQVKSPHYYAIKYQNTKQQEHDKRLMKQLIGTIQSAGYCWRCRRIILPRGKKHIKQHMEQYHSY